MPSGNDIIYSGLRFLDGKTTEIYRECETLFSRMEEEGRVIISPFEGGVRYAIPEDKKIPSIFMEFFRGIKRRPTAFGSAKIKDFIRHREWGKSYYLIEPYFIFVPASVPEEDRDYKTVHEYVELCTQDWRRAVRAAFKLVSAKNNPDFLRRYMERWIADNKEWLETAPPERRGFMRYLHEDSKKILAERGYL